MQRRTLRVRNHARGRQLAAAAVLLLSACASHAPLPTQQRSVDASMLIPDGSPRTQLDDRQLFLMAVAIDKAEPIFPEGSAADARVEVCVRFIVTVDGNAVEPEPVEDAPGCQDSRAQAARPYMDSVIRAVSTWTFFGAALCNYQTDERECDELGAEIIPVPIRIAYRFTFAASSGVRSVEVNALPNSE